MHGCAAFGVPWARVTPPPGIYDELNTPLRVLKVSQNDSLSSTLCSITQLVFFGCMEDQHPDWTCAFITFCRQEMK